MASLKERINTGFGTMGALLARHRLKTLVLLLVAMAALVYHLPQTRFDTSTESFFRKDDPALIAYDHFREQFGRDEFIVVGIDPPNVFDPAFLKKLRAFQQALENEVPYLDEVTSLINARDTRAQGDELIVEDLIGDKIPQSPEAMARLRKRVMSSHLYPNLLISKDGRFTTVMIETLAYVSPQPSGDLLSGFASGGDPFASGGGSQAPVAPDGERHLLTDQENSEIVHAVRKVIARFDGPDFPTHLAGSPVVTDQLKRSMQRDMMKFLGLAVLTIGLFLGVLFRRFSGVVLPLIVVGLSLVATLGLMATLDTALKLPQMILPSFLLAVGVGASVHLLTIFFRRYLQDGDKGAALRYAMNHSGLPIVMTSLTTAAGLFSFAGAEMASVAQLGIFAGIGVLLALVFTLVALPALVGLVPLRRHPRFLQRGEHTAFDNFLSALSRFSVRRAWWIIAATVVVVVVAAIGLPSLKFSHNTLKWFPRSMPLRQATDLIDKRMDGTVTVEMVIDGLKENAFYEPAMLNRLQALAQYAEQYRRADGNPFVGKTQSLVDVVKEVNLALNEDRPEAYRIPQSRQTVAQELLLFENSGSTDLERLVDRQYRLARLSIKVPWDDASVYVKFVDALQHKGEALFGDSAKVTTTGLLKLFTQAVQQLMTTMVESYFAAGVVITLLMILLIGRIRLGLLSMIPNLSPILLTLGLMGWAGIRLDAFTLLIGGIALGLAVDDTIHFFHNFIRYYNGSGNTLRAVEETMLSTGRAMLFTTMVLITGFWLFMFASLNNLFNFGLLTGFTLLMALLADFLLAPAMMAVLLRRREKAGEGATATGEAVS